MPDSVQGPTKPTASTQDIFETLTPPHTSELKEKSLSVRGFQKKPEAGNTNTHTPLNGKAVHDLLFRLKNKPSTDAQFFEQVTVAPSTRPRR